MVIPQGSHPTDWVTGKVPAPILLVILKTIFKGEVYDDKIVCYQKEIHKKYPFLIYATSKEEQNNWSLF